ncbi:hypothetical protein DEA06_08420 [Microbacterium sp. Gd 4-13]|nr:hypothetical protein DEA06_08420 [Microbacterium sp. Gd 4-13]
MKIAAVALLGALLVGAPSPTPTPIADGSGGSGIGIQLLDIPVDAQDDSRARTNIVDNVAPGTTIQRRVTISNFDGGEQQASVSAAASTVVDGAFTPDDAHPNELVSWISVDHPTLTLPARSAADVTVTIAVPADAPEGEQYATVWAQADAGRQTASGVTIVNRSGIRVYLSVGAGNGPASDFAIEGVTASTGPDGVPQIDAVVHNTGGRAIDVKGSVALRDGPGMTSAGPFDLGTATTILPGATHTVSIPLAAGLSAGPWTAALTLRSGLTERTETATVAFPVAEADAPVPAPQLWSAVLVAGAGLVALSALVWALVLLRRRSSRAHARAAG